MILSALIIAGFSIALAVQNFLSKDQSLRLEIPSELAIEGIGYAMMVIEAALAVLIIVLGIKHKKILASILAAIQCPLLIWF